MKVRVQMSRRGGELLFLLAGKPLPVHDGTVILKPRHLKLLGIPRQERNQYVLLDGRTVAVRHPGYCVKVKDLPLPGFSYTEKDFGYDGRLIV